MTSKTRLKQIQKKLKMGRSNDPLTYWTLLCVDKHKPFEKTISSLNNNFVNINKGKEFLERKSLEELPVIKQKIKNIYKRYQAEIKKDPKVGGTLVFANLKDV